MPVSRSECEMGNQSMQECFSNVGKQKENIGYPSNADKCALFGHTPNFHSTTRSNRGTAVTYAYMGGSSVKPSRRTQKQSEKTRPVHRVKTGAGQRKATALRVPRLGACSMRLGVVWGRMDPTVEKYGPYRNTVHLSQKTQQKIRCSAKVHNYCMFKPQATVMHA